MKTTVENYIKKKVGVISTIRAGTTKTLKEEVTKRALLIQ